MTEFKEYLEKVKKINQKIRIINDFEAYELDSQNGIKSKDIQDLIDALKMQHDFIFEVESVHKIWVQVKARLERFCNKEFVSLNS